jgi:hypothetical protein
MFAQNGGDKFHSHTYLAAAAPMFQVVMQLRQKKETYLCRFYNHFAWDFDTFLVLGFHVQVIGKPLNCFDMLTPQGIESKNICSEKELVVAHTIDIILLRGVIDVSFIAIKDMLRSVDDQKIPMIIFINWHDKILF